jgi:homoserine O-acetyltransferase
MAEGGIRRVEQGGGVVRLEQPLQLDSGQALHGAEVAYKTYGVLNEARSNAILICHALTGDQHVASPHPHTGKPGWWARMVGPGLPIDTDRFFVVASNVIGGCMGSTGPSSENPATHRPYGLGFPVITIGDMVRAQAALMDALGVEKLFAVIGGSMGGMLALQWASAYPERIASCLVIASAPRHSAQNIAFNEVGRQAVMADPEWKGGDYLSLGGRPEKGLAVARMAAHITYLSDPALQRKFGRELQADGLSWGFDADFQVESYLRHQGASFVDRFDANSYLYITRALDYFDLAGQHGGVLAKAFERSREVRFLVVSFSSDWLYPTAESRSVARALNAAGARVSCVEIESDKGHDAFLLDEPVFDEVMAGFLRSTATDVGL